MKRPLKPGVFGHAQFAMRDGRRAARIRLDRWWDATLKLEDGRPADDRYRPLAVLGVNPSEADGEWDDNTIDKVTKLARREGANGLVMTNLHPAITKDPDRLAGIALPYGTDELHWEAVEAAMSENVVAVVAGWGKPPRGLTDYAERVARVKNIVSDVGRTLLCLATNKDGSPGHPLYLPDASPLVPWWPSATAQGEPIHGYDIVYLTSQGDERSCHYVGSETAVRRRTMLRSLARSIVSLRPLTKQQYEHAFGYRGRM